MERFIQTVRNQALALVAALEENMQGTIPGEHAIRAWALCHAAWLLNRYHVHSALMATPYETLMGKMYSGVIAQFGEYVYGLKRPMVKGTASSIWSGGVWLGKNDKDENIVAIGDGVFFCRTVRRCSAAWRKEEVMNVSKAAKVVKPRVGFAPMPMIAEEQSRDPQGGRRPRF